MNTQELMQELNSRIFIHKVAIVGGVLTQKYINEQKSRKGAMLPEPIINQQAEEYSQQILAKALATGTLNTMYEQTWEEIGSFLPDNTNLVSSVHILENE
jgi:hypothetical protein